MVKSITIDADISFAIAERRGIYNIRHKGPSIKDVRTKSRKIDPSPLSAKCPHKLNPPCPCGNTINFEKSEVFYAKKCG